MQRNAGTGSAVFVENASLQQHLFVHSPSLMAREVSAVRKEVDSDVSVVGILRGRADAQDSGQRLVSVTDIEMGGDYS